MVRVSRDDTGQLFADCPDQEHADAVLAADAEAGKAGEEPDDAGIGDSPTSEASGLPSVDIPATTHDKNMSEIADLVEQIDDMEALNRLLEFEKDHPKYADGRKGAVSLILERIAELNEE